LFDDEEQVEPELVPLEEGDDSMNVDMTELDDFLKADEM